MLRRIWGAVKRFFSKQDSYRNLSEYTFTHAGPIRIVITKNRGLLRSVDKQLGYRKDKSQSRNWKRRWRP